MWARLGCTALRRFAAPLTGGTALGFAFGSTVSGSQPALASSQDYEAAMGAWIPLASSTVCSRVNPSDRLSCGVPTFADRRVPAATAVLDQHFNGTASTSDSPWSCSGAAARTATTATNGQRVLRIAFLECEDLGEYLSPACYANYGGYYKMNCDAFEYVATLSASALAKAGVQSPLSQLVRVEFEKFNCKAGQLPRSEELSRYDGFYITGSLAGVYDDEPWINRLNDWTANAIRGGHKVVGISFGHQMVVQALGGKVERNPNGSSVSVMDTKLTPQAQQYFGDGRTSFKLLYHHNDAVTRMPPASTGVVEMGGNRTTLNNGVFNSSGTVLTFCGHPDYSHRPPVLHELYEIDRTKRWVGDQLLDFGIETNYNPTDYIWVVHNIMLFYLGELPAKR